VPDGVALPPSLQNIFKELRDDCGIPYVAHRGNLLPWAKQGVLLLNSVLTVLAAMPLSHANRGWEGFTDAIIQGLNADARPKVFILWGSYAQAKGASVDSKRHLVLRAPHPSPLSAHRGFFGSKPFSQANAFLKSQGLEPIDWSTVNEVTKVADTVG